MLPPLKIDPKYGYFPWWPEAGAAAFHPDDVAAARTLIPSGRIFCRDGLTGEYGIYRYGDATLRIKPVLWQEVEPEGLEIGDWVEVRPRGLVNEPRTGVIAEMLWDAHEGAIRYQILETGRPIDTLYAREDLKLVEPTS
ncbi:MAG: hypothetical protein AB7G28_18010 [Pirellulales bacterium]